MKLTTLGESFNAYSGAKPTLEIGLERAGEELMEAVEAAQELQRADATGGTCSFDNVAEELADVIITLASVAAWLNIDLDAAIRAKHAINMRRTWAPHPTRAGCVKHVRK